MAKLICRCECGQRMTVPESAIGKTGKCVRCGRSVAVRRDAAIDHPRGFEPSPDESEVVSPSGGHDGARCARCGRAFRGDWDRNPWQGAVYCHVCANQMSFASVSVPKPLPEHDYGRVYREPPPPKDKKSPRRIAIEISVIVALGIAAFVILTLLPTETTQQASDAEPAELDPAWTYVLAALNWFLRILRRFVTLYAVLASAKKLPNDTLFKNLIALAIVAAGVVLYDATVGAFISIIPLIGFMIAEGIVMFFVWDFYNLRFEDIILWVLVAPLAGIVIRALRLFTYGLVANLAF